MTSRGIAALVLISFAIAPCAVRAQEPHQIAKSRVTSFKGNFDSAVAAYASELADWRAHMAKVEQDKKSGAPKDKAYQPFPAPTADPEVMASVNAAGTVSYTIVNDDPDVLAATKAALINQVSRDTSAAIAAVFPVGKRALATLRENDIRQADAARMKTVVDTQRGILPAVGIGSKTQAEMLDEVARARPTDDTKFLQDLAERRQTIAAIERAAAQTMNDIEDLTIENVDAYVIAPLPN